MLNSTTWLYGAEVLPISLRSKVMGVAAASHFIVNVGSKFSVSPTTAITFRKRANNFDFSYRGWTSAFANIQENYYYVFVACSFFFLVMAYLYFP